MFQIFMAFMCLAVLWSKTYARYIEYEGLIINVIYILKIKHFLKKTRKILDWNLFVAAFPSEPPSLGGLFDLFQNQFT